MNESEKFRRLAFWVKVRRWVITAVITVIVILVAMPVAYKLTQIKAGKESREIIQQMSLDNEIMSPNIKTSDQYIDNTSMMGGQVVSHRYKEIEGYRIPWTAVVNSYSWLGIGGSNMAANATDWGDRPGSGLYDRTTQQKIPVFFNPQFKKPEVKVTADIDKIAQTKDAVAEVAVTFKRPMSYRQVRAKLPAKLHAQWYWIGASGRADTTMMDNNILGIQVMAPVTHPSRLSPSDYDRFAKGLAAAGKLAPGMNYDGFDLDEFAGKYERKYPTLDQAKFAGVIVTGNSEAFRPLDKANWIYASSAGFFKQRSVIK